MWLIFSCLSPYNLDQLFCYFVVSSFSYHRQLMVFHWNLSDRKSPQVSRTLLSILANLSNAVAWMAQACPTISNSFSSLTRHLGTVSSVPNIIAITITFIFNNFFSSLGRSKQLSLFSFSLIFTLWSTGVAIQFSFFFLLSYNFSPDLYQRPNVRESSDFCFAASFGGYFSVIFILFS